MNGKLKMISASAGAGKTYSLSTEITKSIEEGTQPENIMATTFTNKAAEELIERIRLFLLEKGDGAFAARILDGYVGTMNSVFGRLLREFAFELGLSPVQKVLSDIDASNIFRELTSEVNEKFYRDYYNVFFRMKLDDDKRNWRKIVEKIVEQARQNNMTPEQIRECADYSWEQMNAWMPNPLDNGNELDQELISALKVAKSQLPGGDKTQNTKRALDVINYSISEWERRGFLTWEQWARLSKLNPGAKSREIVSPIIAIASKHPRHPKLHDDIKDTIYAVFHCAAEAIEVYQEEKNKRGFIDFTDQEAIALQLLSDEQNAEALKDRISEVFVDEFQDSSPLQVALIMKLRQIAKKSTWVGDVKQAIYGFRGTDPELMKLAMDNLQDMEVDILGISWRSRENLVKFVNEVFTPVFKARGLAEDRVKLEPNPEKKEVPEQSCALEAWTYAYPERSKKERDYKHLAYGVEKVLLQKEKYLIMDKHTKKLRPLKASDIAILCRSNDECSEIAEALSKRGIRATVGEKGLLNAPEVVFTLAALRYLVDPHDTLAKAEIIHFTQEGEEGYWLKEWINEDKREEKNVKELFHSLDHVRENIKQMSPSEVLDLAIVTAKVDETVLTWSQGDMRLANLEALRNLAKVYEDNAETERRAATTSGFLLFLANIRDDDDFNEMAQFTDDHAVRVATYHKAKGLEWPFVILQSLERSSIRNKAPVFDSVIPVSTEQFNVENPLYGRKLYYWPWPYGSQEKNVGFDEYVTLAPQYAERIQQVIEENQRLMYVGMTRARDYLVFATRDFSKVTWLHELTDMDGNKVMKEFRINEGEDEDNSVVEINGEIIVNDKSISCKFRILSIDEEEEKEDLVVETEEGVYFGKKMDGKVFVPARFSPSKLINNEKSIVGKKEILEEDASKFVKLGNRIPITGQPDMEMLGDMVHAFLAADDRDKSIDERLELAKSFKKRFDIHAISEESMVIASDRLAKFIDDKYPNVISINHEWPIHLRKGLQKASGWIDLLIETKEGYVIIDHKTFPGKQSEWYSKGTSYIPQLQIYTEAVQKGTDKPVIGVWIHMPVVGTMINFTDEALKPIIEVNS